MPNSAEGPPAPGPAEPCPCGHAEHEVPRTMRDALALAGHRTAIEHLLTPVALDPSRWLGVHRCVRCGRHWAEDSITSGHADLFFVYPVHTADPRAWLAAAHPLQPDHLA